ncbi:MAG: hypothetical protein DLD55_03000 [candidate division SR1 bacterium]|nr:MAG: hypothetical protein DLD55_03000 [candidate division SR1 bacterium]
MKKIKFLILALLGISIIPTATNAYDIVNKFNGNYGLLYTEFKGSVLYRCPYSSNIDLSNKPQRKATSSSFPCVPGTNFNNTASSDQFYNYPTVSRNADVYQYITALKKKDGKYLPFGVNIQRKFGKFVVEHKNGTVEYDDALIWGWSNYGVSLKSSDGKYGDLLGGLFLDGLLIRSHTRDGEYTRPAYTSVIVIDTKTGYGYRFKTNVSLKENLDTSFFATFYALSKGNYDACGLIPTARWRDNLIEHSFPSGNNCPELDINKRLEESLTVSKEMWKIFKDESPYYDPNYKVNKLFGEVPETITPSVNSAEAYNQCLAYYNSVKTYASYDRNCYKDLLDNNQDIGLRQQITDWDGEGEGPATDNRICNLRKGYKKSYKTKFKDKWSEFLELSSANRLSPHSLNVKDYCGERPKIEENLDIENIVKDDNFLSKAKNFVQGMFANKGEGTGFNYSEKVEYNNERFLCFMFGWLNDFYCNSLKDPNTKNRYIKADQQKGIDNSGGFSSFFSLLKVKFEEGKKFLGATTCSNPVFLQEWDFLVYLPMFLIVLYLIRLISNVK